VDRQSLGLEAETRAVQLFEQAGFTVLSRNFRCRAGELDIIAQRGEMLVIAEVRLRSDAEYGGAAASITPAKRKRIIRAARYLLRRRPARRSSGSRTRSIPAKLLDDGQLRAPSGRGRGLGPLGRGR
jgi:putative endonuclease